MVVRLPRGEVPFMREAIEDNAPTMNATSAVLSMSANVESVPDSDLETALRTLGVWDDKLVAL